MKSKYWPCLVIIAIYVLCIVIANPKGEFPLNDDWSYTRSAFSLGSGHGLQVDEWCAPSVIGQALYGGLLSRIFSCSFFALRISTLFLSCCTALLVWGILLRLEVRKDLAGILLLAWLFNPLQFSLSFTYMTEIPSIFFIVLGLYFYVSHLENGRIKTLVLSAAALGYGFLIRQTALFFILALIGSLLLDARLDLRMRLRKIAVAFCSAGAFVAAYYIWTVTRGGSTAAVLRKFDLLHNLTERQFIGNSYGMFFYIVFILAPVWIFLLPRIRRTTTAFSRLQRIGIPAALAAVMMGGIWWFHDQYRPAGYLLAAGYHSRMPFLLNVLYDTGLGPLTLDGDYYGSPATPVYPQVWQAVTALIAVGSVISGCICIFGLLRMRRNPPNGNRRSVLLFAGLSFLLLFVFEIFFSHVQEGGLFDRHILIVSLPFCLLLGLLSGPDSVEVQKSRGWVRLIPSLTAVALIGSFCVAATRDYMEWNRIRWDMGRSLLKQGVGPLVIAGGFEFNAWNNYDTFVARGNIARTHHWWYDRPDHLISMMPQDGYAVRQTRQYFSWVHRREINMYLLSRIGQSTGSAGVPPAQP